MTKVWILLLWQMFLTVCRSGAVGPPRNTGRLRGRQVAKIGESKKISCPVEADPAPFIQWTKDGVDILHEEWTRYKVLPDGSLRIKDINMEDAGHYNCKAINGFGSISINYTLVIIDTGNNIVREDQHTTYKLTDNEDILKEGSVPRFVQPEKMKRQHIVRPVGSSIRLKCRANGNPRPQLSWHKDAKVIATEEERKDRQSWTLKLRDLKESDSGRYTCKVTNRLGSINYTYTLEVIEKIKTKPVLLPPNPLNTTVEYGGKASLKCNVESVVQPHIQWLKRIEDPNQDSNLNTTINVGGQKFVVLKTGEVWNGPDGSYLNKLIIEHATEADAGMYICLGANSMGYSFRSAFLTVLPNPQRSTLSDDSSNTSLPLVIALPAFVVIVVVTVAIIILQRHLRRKYGNNSNTNIKASPRFNPVPQQEQEPFPQIHNQPVLHVNPMHNPPAPLQKDMFYPGVQNPHLIHQSSREKLSKNNHSIDCYTDISSVSQSHHQHHHGPQQYSY